MSIATPQDIGRTAAALISAPADHDIWLRLAGLLVAGLLPVACGGRESGGAWTMRVDTLPAGAAPGTHTAASLRTNGKEGPEGEAPTHAVVLSLDCFHDNATVAIMTDQALRQGSTDVRVG